MWAALATVITALLSFIQSRKPDPEARAAQTINEANRATADIARQADEDLHVKTAEVAADAAGNADRLRHAGGLHEQNTVAASAVDSANDPV